MKPLPNDLIRIPRCCSTVSIGTLFIEGGHVPLLEKLAAIADAGFQGVELALWDLQPFASELLQRSIGPEDYVDLALAGREVRRACEALSLKIVVLVACFRIEGWPRESEERRHAFSTVKQFKTLMHAVGTDTLLLAASDADEITTSFSGLASDLTAIADYLAEDGFRVAYEDICWATAAPNWKAGWELVKKVNRANFGLCLDTFHIAAYEWADPTTVTGRRDESDTGQRFFDSLEELAATVPSDRIFLLQIGDAYRFPRPIPAAVGVKPREIWARNSRPLPCGRGGFLPVVEIVQAIFKTGYRDWCSIEVFDGGPAGDRPRSESARKQAAEAMAAYQECLQESIDGHRLNVLAA